MYHYLIKNRVLVVQGKRWYMKVHIKQRWVTTREHIADKEKCSYRSTVVVTIPSQKIRQGVSRLRIDTSRM
jgi:hypothetical protein